jgi:glycosyltransferase involved in cell wall biosynthesis
MHIAMVTETYPPEVNGVARTIGLMADGLRALGHTIQLVRPRQNPADAPQAAEGYEELLRPGIPIPRYAQLKMGAPSGRALEAAWRTRRPDVVHVATEGPLGWSALGAARRLGLPVASDFHTNFHAYSRHYGAAWLARPVAAWLRRFHNRCDCTMVPTDEMAADLARLGFERLRVVGRGVNSDTFSPARRRRELRAQWGAVDATPVALCVSRFAPEKNFPLVLEAYAAMRAANPDVRLVLVGDGPMLAELRRASTGTVIAGRLVNGELSAHYASADVFLFPSESETFGNVTLEAMASGLAVVAYRYAAARQHLEHGRSALLAETGDRAGFIAPAVRLACDPALVRALGRAARAAALPIGWGRITRDFESVLAETAVPRGEAAHAAA